MLIKRMRTGVGRDKTNEGWRKRKARQTLDINSKKIFNARDTAWIDNMKNGDIHTTVQYPDLVAQNLMAIQKGTV